MSALQCLRPCLRSRSRPISRAASSAFLRFYSVAQAQAEPRIRTIGESVEYSPERYPRIQPQKSVMDYKTFAERYRSLVRGETGTDQVVIRGRIMSTRVAGSKLAFVDLFQNNRFVPVHRVQCLFNYDKLSSQDVSPTKFKDFLDSLHRGDIFSVKGIPHRTLRNELSLQATELPQLLSKCTQELPVELKDKEARMRFRHVDLLLDPYLPDVFRLRAEIIKFLRQYLTDEGHVEVQTPILADSAGGAVARPFTTSATEFSDRQIALRIAPELWLKRLILGGFDKVFEIGPSFRNEGIDMNHNPEFTTCEFYRTYADLEELMGMTENMFLRLSRIVRSVIESELKAIEPKIIDFSPPFKRLDFIPAIEEATGKPLPDLTSPTAQSDLMLLFHEKHAPLPLFPTIPRLLDKLSAMYLESRCKEPTWIINPPECLSPLSKSFVHPANQQRVAARAELFIEKQEFVNTYEEENSPAEQRRKFEEQIQYHGEYHGGDRDSTVDESYLQALEWALPPTGGWGCGIDRLCMLFAGTKRIADVLTFGTLRNVVGLRQTTNRML